MGTDEYVPAGGDNYEIKPDFPQFRLRGEDGGALPSGARGTVLQWNTYRKQLPSSRRNRRNLRSG